MASSQSFAGRVWSNALYTSKAKVRRMSTSGLLSICEEAAAAVEKDNFKHKLKLKHNFKDKHKLKLKQK
jgi:hypothetical protein